MDEELTSLRKLKDRLEKDFDAATKALPEKIALDHTVSLIALLEDKKSTTIPHVKKKLVLVKKPRTLSTEEDKGMMLAWLDKYYAKTKNKPTGFRQLTDLMLADKVEIPGPAEKQVFVVAGLVTRNKKFRGNNRLWNLAEYAA
jgi:hypothetical protein